MYLFSKEVTKELEGSLIVEASIVMPMTFAVILFLVFTTFRLHDYAVLRATAAEKVVSSTDWEGDAVPVLETPLFYYRSLAWEGEKGTRKGIGMSSEHRKIDYDSEEENEDMERLVDGLLGIRGQRSFSLTESAEWKEYVPKDFIWMCQVFLDDAER